MRTPMLNLHRGCAYIPFILIIHFIHSIIWPCISVHIQQKAPISRAFYCINMIVLIWYGRKDLNLHDLSQDPKSCVSANFTTPARVCFVIIARVLGFVNLQFTVNFPCRSLSVNISRLILPINDIIFSLEG